MERSPEASIASRTNYLFGSIGRELRGGPVAELAAELDGIGAIGFAGISDLELVAVEIHNLVEGDIIAINLAI